MEKNARRLVGVLAEFFPTGSSCGDLREKFQQVTGRKAASFYGYLAYAKTKNWIVTDGAGRGLTVYSLNPDGCWRPPPIGEGIERHQFEHVLEMKEARIEQLERLNDMRKAVAAGQATGGAIGTLVEIMLDTTTTMRGRLQAAESLLAYKTPENIAQHAKQFLSSVFLDKEQNLDHRLAATQALRRAEDVRLMPPIERPDPAPPRDVDPAKEQAEREAEFLRKKAYVDQATAEIAREFGYVDNSTHRVPVSERDVPAPDK
jgi:hypothetical protein